MTLLYHEDRFKPSVCENVSKPVLDDYCGEEKIAKRHVKHLNDVFFICFPIMFIKFMKYFDDFVERIIGDLD